MSYSSSKQIHTETLTKLLYNPFHGQVKKTTIFIIIAINHHRHHKSLSSSWAHQRRNHEITPPTFWPIIIIIIIIIVITIIIMALVINMIMTNCNDDDGGPTQKQSRNYSAVYSDGERKGCLTHSEMILAIIISRVISCSHFLFLLTPQVLQ